MTTVHHTARFEGQVLTRTSTTRHYTHVLVGYRWKSVKREFVRRGRGLRSRSTIRTEVDHAAGISDKWEVIGWAGSLDAAERRCRTDIGSGFARIEIIPADAQEQRPAQPRPWQLRPIALVEHLPDQYDPSPTRGLEMHYGRCGSYPSEDAAHDRGRELIAAGQADGYEIAIPRRGQRQIVLRGGLGELLPRVRGHFDRNGGIYLAPDGQPRRGESLAWARRPAVRVA